MGMVKSSTTKLTIFPAVRVFFGGRAVISNQLESEEYPVATPPCDDAPLSTPFIHMAYFLTSCQYAAASQEWLSVDDSLAHHNIEDLPGEGIVTFRAEIAG